MHSCFCVLIRVSSCVETQNGGGGGSAFNGALLLMVDQPLVIKNKTKNKNISAWEQNCYYTDLDAFCTV